MTEKTENIKFEKALERLEKIVEDLEAGNIPLEDALKKYEEGVKLSRLCQKSLSLAEKKIEILTRSLDGSLQKEPFEFEDGPEENAQDGKIKKLPRAAAQEDNITSEEELLF